MPLPAPIRIAIATDLHYLESETGEISPQICMMGSSVDPMASLINIISLGGEGVIKPQADLLICPGDITTRACVKSFRKGWSDLNDLKNALSATHLIAATGNHEVSSRAKGDHSIAGNAEAAVEPFEHLIATDNYPANFDDPLKKWIYWGRGFEIVSGDNWVVVTINSCHYHSTLVANEYERGRIGDLVLLELEKILNDLAKKFVYRIVVLHHPPGNHEELDVSLGRIHTYNGEKLLKAIQNTSEDWIVIHGHKHLFRLTPSEGTEYAPIIIGAASFGALMTGDLAGKTKNQFYILELSLLDEGRDSRLTGRFESICWDGSVWSVSNMVSHGLPHGCGFNRYETIRSKSLAQSIKKYIETSGEPVVTWSEICEEISVLCYLMPQDIENLNRKLVEVGVCVTPPHGAWFPQELWVAS
ncbi:metallophosphoesterase family protein [Pseudomonas putida]|uniref:metallophosphoesterase family protein n=1 Tax=Pseudomonas putida TaxID=303 RepID=UPI0009C17C62|nr:metallophosphoesterase [Pseudomonas putida]